MTPTIPEFFPTIRFLVSPATELQQFLSPIDRDYFSRPVLVEPLWTDVSTRLVQVRDPRRGHEYPVQRKHLRGWHGLTAKQRKEVESK